MFNNTKKRLENLIHIVSCPNNHQNLFRRMGLIEGFKGEAQKGLLDHKANIEGLYDLQERLGQKVKDNRDTIAGIFSELFVELGLELDEYNHIIKTKNVKASTLPASSSSRKRKSK